MDDEPFVKGINIAFNQIMQERSSLSISKKLDELAILGYHTGSIVPFGYRVVKVDTDSFGHTIIRKELILHPAESITVKTLFELANELITQGKFSYTTIAEMLNEKGLLRRKSIWTQKNLKITLTNTRYCGVTVYGVNRSEFNTHKKPVKIDCLAIVSKPLFDQVNRFVTELRI